MMAIWFRRTVFAFGMHLDQDLLCAHDLDNLTHVGARLLKQTQLLAQQAHSRVVVVPLRFQSAEDGLTLDDLELHALDLVVKEGIERHIGRSNGVRH